MAIADRTELVMQRRQTRAMIEADPTEIVLTRSTWTRNSTNGGRIADVNELPPQRVRVLAPYISRRGRQNEAFDETLKSMPYSKETLLCFHTADIERHDLFEIDGIQYRVSFVYNNREYEILANIETVQAET